MAALRIDDFSGMVPRTSPTQLQDNQAQIAKNVKIQSLELRPWNGPTQVYSPTASNLGTIYKFAGESGITPIWLTWPGDVDVVPGPVADLAEFRLYFTSSTFGPRKTNWAMASDNNAGVDPFPDAWYEMGVPTPTVAATASAAGTGTAPVETRSYVYTYVTEFGVVAEESAPSPATIVTANYSGDSVTLSNFGTPPTGNYNFRYRRIYRSVIGATSSAYQLVAEIPIATASYVDTKAAAALGVTLESYYFTPPPPTLRGLVALPNGILAGFTGNQVWFCEPYKPHAWPSTYMITTEYPIVGLGVFGNTLFVGTTRNPYLVTGTTPASMSQDKLPIVQPCVSKKSIASDQFGVLYSSPNGLVSIAPGVQDVISQALYTRDEWQALNPGSIIGALYNNMYFGFHTVMGERKSFVVQRGDNPPLINLDSTATTVFVEPGTGLVHYLSATDNKIYTLDTDPTSPSTFQWRSKVFMLPKPVNFGAMQLHADYTNLGLNGRYVNVKIYADGAQVASVNMTSEAPVRLPSSVRAYRWEIEITGQLPVRRVIIGSTMTDIAGA
jgi:hypothetical protein